MKRRTAAPVIGALMVIFAVLFAGCREDPGGTVGSSTVARETPCVTEETEIPTDRTTFPTDDIAGGTSEITAAEETTNETASDATTDAGTKTQTETELVTETETTQQNTAEPTDEPPSETPTAPDVSVFTVTFDAGTPETAIPTQSVAEGQRASAPDVSRDGYVLRRWLNGGKEYDFSSEVQSDLALTAEWLERTNLPVTVIELRASNGGEYNIEWVDRENYVASTITVMNAAGEYEVRNESSGFKGRGNGSWNDPKKCFRIKFDQKKPLFGRAANKNWVLLACTNFNDGTLLRNYTAYNLAGNVFTGLEYVTNAVWTDLYVNGEYRGVYVLCEHVRVGEGRVDIESRYGEEDTGFLIEYDAYASGIEGIDWFSITDGNGGTRPGGWGGWGGTGASNGIVKYNFTVHSPDPGDYQTKGKITEEEYRAQVAYIREYVKRVYTAAIVDHDYQTLCELVDIDSLVDMYILQEFYKNTDAGWSSFYLYKKPGGKLYFGPPWDFDGTTTAARGEENNPNGIYVAGGARNSPFNSTNELFRELYKTPEFLAQVKTRWQRISRKIGRYFDALFTEDFYTENRYAAGRNFVRWSGQSQGGWGGWGGGGRKITQEQAEKNWVDNCRTLKAWFDGRISYLNGVWGS